MTVYSGPVFDMTVNQFAVIADVAAPASGIETVSAAKTADGLIR